MSGGGSYGGILPVMAVISRGADKVVQVVSIAAADVGNVANTYLGPNGATPVLADATPINATPTVAAVTSVGSYTIAETAITTLSVGVRRKDVSVPGAVVGGNYMPFPSAPLGAGYGLVDAVCNTADVVSFGIIAPVLTLGSYSIGVRLYKVL